ncbi:D-aminoacylase [Chitinophaga sedimenti]|uniref:N-acyl-D-amino-acid deacylase family protein n=1 Tax=Chitinophaga sedimenti TaxID=2033606 RepID=UPI0020057EAB|nr:D-aminoacylase [Chitinophaga sedimenti]MCK7558602.1 D-aminoacylase [Chitinophaga sedimenti]
MRKLPLTAMLLCAALASRAQQCDLLIKNARIIDGTGNNWYYGDVAVTAGKIVRTGNLASYTATKTISANGLTVAPGFIDVHTHIEGDEFKVPTADNFLLDGVTTVITGNCGSSNPDLARYFYKLDSARLSINVASFIGHNDVRRAIIGNSNRQPTPQEQQQMEAMVEKAMKDGAVGLSTGLIYLPGMYAKTEEITGLAKVAARYGGVYATHMRNEADQVNDAIEEALTIGRQANIPVEISHFKVSGKQNWGRSRQTLALVQQAREEGIEVTIDQYPYTASSTSINTLLPNWALSGGRDSIVYRLTDNNTRQQIVSKMLSIYKNRKLKHLDYAVVASFRPDTSLNGKNIMEINRLRGHKATLKNEINTVLDIVKEGGAGMVFHSMNEDDVKYIMQYPFNMFASDAGIRQFNVGVPHPRGYGTNARVLGRYVREQKVISLEEAIRRMTSLPAQKFRLGGRGLLLPGYNADIVIFDPATVTDNSTFEQPHQYATGFKYVLVNGVVTIDEGKHVGARSGMVLKGNQ